MATIVEEYGLRPVSPAIVAGLSKHQADGMVVSSRELIGIEVEVENYTPKLGTLNRVWNVTTDGSLRNNGAEVISKPIEAIHAPMMLNYLFNEFLDNKQCCFGPRTSIHVHLNVQDLTRAQALDFILVYAIYERLFYKFAGRGRQKNVYCVPLSDSDLLVNLADQGETRGGNWSKYTGLNTLPIREYGTIEFRHMHGTINVHKLTTWINLICKLKEYIKRTSTKTVRSMVAEMYDGFDFGAHLADIFGEYANAFRYEGPQELNYIQVKQALTSRASVVSNFHRNLKTDSSFFTFKG